MTPLDIILILALVIISIVVCIAVNKINKEDNTYYGRMCAGCPPRIDEDKDNTENTDNTISESKQ